MKNHQAEHEVIEQKWDEIRSSVRERWPQLTEDDVRQIDGDARKLIALVHQKTGDNIETIENVIDEIAAGSEGLLSRVTRQAQRVAQSATDQVANVAEQAYEAIEHQVDASPARSLATVFGVGFAIGICVTALFHSPNSRKANRWTPHW